MDWQAEISAAAAEAVGKTLRHPYSADRPDYLTVMRALDDAKLEAADAYVDEVMDACRIYGVDPKIGRTNGIVPTDCDWEARDANDDGEPYQLRAFGKSRAEAAFGLLTAVREKFE